MQFVVTEKNFVARSIAAVLGASEKKKGYHDALSPARSAGAEGAGALRLLGQHLRGNGHGH